MRNILNKQFFHFAVLFLTIIGIGLVGAVVAGYFSQVAEETLFSATLEEDTRGGDVKSGE